MASLASHCPSTASAAPKCRRRLFGASSSSSTDATFRLLKSAAAAVKQPHRRSRARGSSSTTSAAFSGRGGDHPSSPSWSFNRKPLVEALTHGSALARAPCAWYVDKTSDINSSIDGSGQGGGNANTTRSVSRSAGPVAADTPSSSPHSAAAYENFPRVMRVNARQAPVSHRALAHADSTECDELRDQLERHIRDGGATVLVTPLVDPLIFDPLASTSAFGDFPSMEYLDDEDEELDCADDALCGLGGTSLGSFGSLARSVDYDGTGSGGMGGGGGGAAASRVLVEGTVCKCDPNDPEDCCARSLATYCTSCPVLASCDEGGGGGGVDAIEVNGSRVDCNACGMSTDLDAGAGAGAGTGAAASANNNNTSAARGVVGDCAFARAVKEAAASHVHRHQYYAAIVQTGHGVGVDATMEDGEYEDGTVVDGVGYEEFIVHRPAGDAWIAGALPPPTSVRRANFGPQLRGELRRLVLQDGFAA